MKHALLKALISMAASLRGLKSYSFNDMMPPHGIFGLAPQKREGFHAVW